MANTCSKSVVKTLEKYHTVIKITTVTRKYRSGVLGSNKLTLLLLT